MYSYRIFLALCLAVATNSARATAYSDTETITHDPFQRPETLNSKVKHSAAALGSVELDWEPRLSMTLRAGKKSMANVDGRLIRLGEQLDGHQLIEVHERSVVFVKQGKIIRLILDNK